MGIIEELNNMESGGGVGPMTEALAVILCSSQAGSPGFGRLGGNPMIEALLLFSIDNYLGLAEKQVATAYIF